jgi:hypothetical protein
MPKRQLPTSFTVVHPGLLIAGVVRAAGASVTALQAASSLGNRLSAYVSRGWIRPNLPQYVQTSKRPNPRSTPTTSYSPAEIRAMRGI